MIRDCAVVNKPIKVAADGCKDVDDFIHAIKKKLSPKLDQVAVNNISLHLTENSPSLEPDDPIPAQNTRQTALVVIARLLAPILVSMAYRKADMSFISESTEVQEDLQVWEHIPVDESIVPCAEFVELFKKNCSVFEFETEASRRTVIDLFLSEVLFIFQHYRSFVNTI